MWGNTNRLRNRVYSEECCDGRKEMRGEAREVCDFLNCILVQHCITMGGRGEGVTILFKPKFNCNHVVNVLYILS